jgi:hypothetical protein
MTAQQNHVDELDPILDQILADLPQEPLPERVINQVMEQFPKSNPSPRPFRPLLLEGVLALLAAIVLGLFWQLFQQGLFPDNAIYLSNKWLSVGLALVLLELGLILGIHFTFFSRPSIYYPTNP